MGTLHRRTPLKRTPFKKTAPWEAKAKEQEKKKAKAGQSKNKLRDKLDAVFSKYIRLKYSDDKGYCRCISCSKIFYWKDIQNGHYMSRRYMSTRFSEDNCRPQCVACNIFNQGNIQMYRRGLIKQIGEQRVDLIEVRARTENKNWSLSEYKIMIDYFQKEVSKLAKAKGIKI